MMDYTQFTDKGPRINNEDCCTVVKVRDKRTLFVVCDGMHGHSCGKVASQAVCDSFSAYWEQHADLETRRRKSWMQQRRPAGSLMRSPASTRWGKP